MTPSLDLRENRDSARELKFQVVGELGGPIRDWARERLAPDPHAAQGTLDGYNITSIYFDTENFDVFHRHGSFGRCKFRIRRYGPSEVVFLERKLKTRGMVSKRRAAVGIEELDYLKEGCTGPGWTGWWYQQRVSLRRLRPVCQISYRRTARCLMTPIGPVRLTMDHDIRAVEVSGVQFVDGSHGALLSEGKVVIELKFRAEMPQVFKELVERFALSPKRVSKYRMAMVALGMASEDEPNDPTTDPVKSSLCRNS